MRLGIKVVRGPNGVLNFCPAIIWSPVLQQFPCISLPRKRSWCTTDAAQSLAKRTVNSPSSNARGRDFRFNRGQAVAKQLCQLRHTHRNSIRPAAIEPGLFEPEFTYFYAAGRTHVHHVRPAVPAVRRRMQDATTTFGGVVTRGAGARRASITVTNLNRARCPLLASQNPDQATFLLT